LHNVETAMAALAGHRRRWEALVRSGRGASSKRDVDPAFEHLTEVLDFGSNPGALRMFKYVPAQPEPALVVVMHGCTQTAADYDLGAGWSTMADRYGFVLLLPQQQPSNNPNTCFTWFLPDDTARGKGEALSIRQMVETMIRDHGIDRGRVFATGLSAGGAMTSVMLATYPETFAAGAMIAGLPYGTATNVSEAFESMFQVRARSAPEWGDLVRAASPHRGPWPRVSVWHGSADQVVKPGNADEIVKQWTNVHGLDAAPTLTETVDGYPREVWRNRAGDSVIESYTIPRMPHGTPLATGRADDCCGVPGAFLLEVGISSSYHIAKFWGLTGHPRRIQAGQAKPARRKPAPALPRPSRNGHPGATATLAGTREAPQNASEPAASEPSGHHLVGPNLETCERVGSERRRDGDVDGVAASCHQHPSDPRHVVARIESVPASAQVGLEPRREVSGRIGWGHPDVAEIAGAVARRNVHGPAQRDGEMGVVAAHAAALIERLPCGLGGARVLVPEGDMIVHEVANRLDPAPTHRGATEQSPRHLGKLLGVAISAAQKKNQRLFGQVLDRMLLRRQCDDVGLAAIAHHGRAGDLDAPLGRDETRAPVAEAIPIGRQGNRRARADVIRHHDVGCARIVDVQHQHHRRRLRTIVDQLVAHPDVQWKSPRGVRHGARVWHRVRNPNPRCGNAQHDFRKLEASKDNHHGRRKFQFHNRDDVRESRRVDAAPRGIYRTQPVVCAGGARCAW
jgi:poly(hydroxyalkanoate) depolymerase family esterase